MRVLINAVGIEQGGGLTALRGLTTELARSASRHHFIIYVGSKLARPSLPAGPNLEWRSAACAGLLRRFWWEQVSLRRLLRKHRADVLYSFANYAMFFCPVPQLSSVHTAVYFSEPYRRRILPRKPLWFQFEFALRRWWLRQSVKVAGTVHLPSESFLAELRNAGECRGEKVFVAAFGTAAPMADVPATAARRLSYEDTIELLLPTLYADYKNLGAVLRALRILRRRHGNRFRLLTMADPRTHSRRTSVTWKEDTDLLDELVREGAVEVAGPLPRDELLKLYARCQVMVYPTLGEAFGFPLVEALAAGLPVVASDIPVNRELAGEAAWYFDPHDAEQLAARLEEVVNGSAVRAQKVQRGLEHARVFCWSACTQQLLSALEKLADRHAGSPG